MSGRTAYGQEQDSAQGSSSMADRGECRWVLPVLWATVVVATLAGMLVICLGNSARTGKAHNTGILPKEYHLQEEIPKMLLLEDCMAHTDRKHLSGRSQSSSAMLAKSSLEHPMEAYRTTSSLVGMGTRTFRPVAGQNIDLPDTALKAMNANNAEADAFIRKVWDEVETFHNEEADPSKRANYPLEAVGYMPLELVRELEGQDIDFGDLLLTAIAP